MSIFRSTDPTTWDDVDGIIINESAPAPNVAGVAANIGILVGKTERGLDELTEIEFNRTILWNCMERTTLLE